MAGKHGAAVGRWLRNTWSDLRHDPDEKRLYLHFRLVLVASAFLLGSCLDARTERMSRLLEVAPVLRFLALDLVSVFASLWPVWIFLTAFTCATWTLLTLRHLNAAAQPGPSAVSPSPGWIYVRRAFGLVVRNLGHLEAAFLTAVFATLWTDRLNSMLTLLAVIFALGLFLTGAIGELYLELHPPPVTPVSDGERLAARRWVIGCVTVCGSLGLLAFVPRQALTVCWLSVTYLICVVMRLLSLQWIRHHCDADALTETSAVTVKWAQRFDLPLTAGLLAVVLALRASVLLDSGLAESADRRARTALPWGTASLHGSSGASQPGGVPFRGASLFIISDSQFHEVRGRRVGVHRNLVDDFVPVAVRPIELDLLSGVTFRHFGDVYRALKKDRPAMLWAHLGDFADLACPNELDRAEDYVRWFARGSESQLAALVPGNHDSTFAGNFVWHPDWEDACRPAGDPSTRAFFVTKPETNERLKGMMTPWLPPGTVRLVQHPFTNGSSTALASLRVLDEAGDKVVGVFLDTSDYTFEDAVRGLGLAGEQGNVSRAQADLVRKTLHDDYPRARVILFMHHPFGALSGPAQDRLRDIASELGPRILAVVSAHTHLAALRSLDIRPGMRAVPELIVGSILDPPQEAALLDVLPDDTIQFTTIPAVERSKSPPIRYPDMVTEENCRRVLAELGTDDRCGRLLRDSSAENADQTLDPDHQKRAQQERAVRLFECLGIDLGGEQVFDDGSCPEGAPTARACPLDAPSLYAKLDQLIRQDWDMDSRSRLVCLARAGSLLQGHKSDGWGFAEALRYCVDSSVDDHPMLVERDPKTGALGAHNLCSEPQEKDLAE